ncbi:MAG: hypothetical protein JRG96_02980 [Deltaproteobacteria bacterium]|nr:hypothetical protein [Deltaproteobacteria bacterium]MBW2420773.1 hypothetical protein [Deltaproteobacteria bacterium]
MRMRTPSTLWIVHRDPQRRAALSRLAGAGQDVVLGAPTDGLFETANQADVVVMGLSGSFESELEFAHRMGPRQGRSMWILLPDASGAAEARRLFDTLPSEIIPYPPDTRTLRRSIHSALHRLGTDPLSRRQERDVLAARFSRWFADLDLPGLLRALDPQLASIPLLIRSESGCGRSLLARYVHAFGGTGDSVFVHIACREATGLQDLLDQAAAPGLSAARPGWTVFLEDVDHLSSTLQRKVQDWIDFGLPEGVPRGAKVRWIASASDDEGLMDGFAAHELELSLAQALCGLEIRIPPLRERPHAIAPLVGQTAAAWCRGRSLRVRRFSSEAVELLEGHPWPGNLRELSAVVESSLALSSADPLLARQLHFPAEGRPRVAAPAAGRPEPRDYFVGDAEEEEEFDETLEDESDEPFLAPALHVELAEATRERRDSALPPGRAVPVAPPVIAPAEAEPAPDFPPEASQPADSPEQEEQRDTLRRLVTALAHEVRNPLVSIRTFSELLPESYDDPDFRTRFQELVGRDVRRIEDVITRLHSLTEVPEAQRQPVDVAALLDSLLDERREEIQARRLLVLKELDRNQPFALGDRDQLRSAFAGLLAKALELVPERGDVYLASKHHTAGLHGAPTVRVLLRYHNPEQARDQAEIPPRELPGAEGISLEETALEFIIAESIIRGQGGALTVDNTDAQETVIVIDLTAPSSS